jgi:hypothetical protein
MNGNVFRALENYTGSRRKCNVCMQPTNQRSNQTEKVEHFQDGQMALLHAFIFRAANFLLSRR